MLIEHLFYKTAMMDRSKEQEKNDPNDLHGVALVTAGAQGGWERT